MCRWDTGIEMNLDDKVKIQIDADTIPQVLIAVSNSRISDDAESIIAKLSIEDICRLASQISFSETASDRTAVARAVSANE